MLSTRNEETNTVFYSYLACFCEYIHLEYIRIHAIYRVNQAEYVIHILVVAPQEYVSINSTHRIGRGGGWGLNVLRAHTYPPPFKRAPFRLGL